MTVTRVNGCPINLEQLSDDALFKLGEYVRRNIDQAESELEKVNEEMARRELFLPEPAA